MGIIWNIDIMGKIGVIWAMDIIWNIDIMGKIGGI